MSKYNILIFDADGTLFDFAKSEADALIKSFNKFNLHFDYNKHLKVYRTINHQIWSEFENGSISADNLKPERFRRFTSQFNFSIEPSVFSNAYLNYLAEAAFLLEGANGLLNKIKGKFKLVLLTNGLTKVQRRRFALTNMKEYFDAIIISEEVGFKKPQVEIFDLALKKIGHSNKSDVLMIGDNLSSDILGGKNYNIDTCWYNPTSIKNDLNIIPSFEVSSFQELLTVLELE